MRIAVSYPAISLATTTVGRHRRPPKRLQTAANPPSTRIRARTIAFVISSHPLPVFSRPQSVSIGGFGLRHHAGIQCYSCQRSANARIVEAARHSPDWAIWAFIGLQLLAIVFLLIGGWLALRALRIAEIHVWTLADERSNTTSEERNATIGWYIQKDQLISTLKANNLDASYSCIRNGVLVLALAAALALILVAFSEPPAAGTEEEGAIRRSPKVGIVVPQTDRVEQLQKATRSWSYLPHSMPQHNAASRC